MSHPRALVLTLHSIRSLTHESEPDPYVVVEVREDAKPKGGKVLEKFKSGVKKDAVVPVTFEETFVLCRKMGIAGPKIGARAKVVRVHVWEYNRLKDRAYGYFDIDLAQFRNNRSMSLDHAQLKVYKKGNTSSKHVGVLELSMCFAAAVGRTGAPGATGAAGAAGGAQPPPLPARHPDSESKAQNLQRGHRSRSSLLGDEVPNVLCVDILSCAGLRNADGPGGKSDPYVKVKTGKKKGKTRTIDNNHNPIFNERLEFRVKAPAQSPLQIEVFDKDFGMSDDRLGHIAPLNLNTLTSLLMGDRVEMEIPLIGKKAKRGSTVTIALEWYFAAGQDASAAQDKERVYPSPVPMDDGLSEIVADDAEGVEKETEEEKAARLAEEKAELERLKSIVVPPGDYQIQVHIIECRDIKPEDLDGLSDPVVYVTCFDDVRHTAVHRQCTGCTFDQTLFFNIKDLDREMFEAGEIKVSLFDADTFSRNDLVGSYTFDAMWVFYQKNHEVYRQWVGLVDERNPADKGIQGYLQVSIAIVPPGGTLKTHDRALEQAAEWAEADAKAGSALDGDISAMILMPPTIKQEMNFLVVNVHALEDLPHLDKTTVGGDGGLDPYVHVFSGGNQCKSSVRSLPANKGGRLCAEINESLYLPLVMPSMSNTIRVMVMDRDGVTGLISDDVCGTVHESILNCKSETLGPLWYNLYGSNEDKKSSKVARQMNRNGHLGSTFRGRVLLSFRMDHNLSKSLPERPFKKNIRRCVARNAPIETPYTLRALVYSGDQLPFTSKTCVQISFGRFTARTQYKTPKSKTCLWGEQLECSGEYPEDLEQAPDIFVHLYVNPTTWAKENAICYARFKAKDLIESGVDGNPFANIEPKWVILKEDPSMNKVENSFPGSILMKLAFGPSGFANTPEANWDADIKMATGSQMSVPHILRVNLYQARNIPACDPDGSCDPQITVHVGGANPQKLPKKMDTTDPIWYRSLDFNVNMPSDRRLWPMVSMSIFDWDRFGSNDYVGAAHVDTSSVAHGYVPAGSDLPDPAWYPLFYCEPGDSQGEILCSIQCLGTSDSNIAAFRQRGTSSIKPKMRKAWVEISALGLRNLKAPGMLNLHAPCVEFDLGTGQHSKVLPKTKPSSKPTSQSPNFCEILTIEADLPVNPLFAPRLNIRVVDQQFGGFVRKTVGVAAIDLKKKIPPFPLNDPEYPNPWYEPPQSGGFGDTRKVADAEPVDPSSMVGMHGDTDSKVKDRDTDTTVPYIIGPDGAAVDPETKERISPSKLRRILLSRQKASRAKKSYKGDEAKALAGGGHGGAMMFGSQVAESIVQSGAPGSGSGSGGESKTKLNPLYGDDAESTESFDEIDINALDENDMTALLAGLPTEDPGEDADGDDTDEEDESSDSSSEDEEIGHGEGGAMTFGASAKTDDLGQGAGQKKQRRKSKKQLREEHAQQKGLGLKQKSRLVKRMVEETSAVGGVREVYVEVNDAEEAKMLEETKKEEEMLTLEIGPPVEDMCLESTASEGESSSGEGKSSGTRPVAKRRLDKKTQKMLDNDSFYGAEMPDYLQNREIQDTELEKSLGSAPFETYQIYRGQAVETTLFGTSHKSSYSVAGAFKCLVRVTFVKEELKQPLIDVDAFLTPKQVMVRLYVLQGYRLNPMDADGYSDAFVKVLLDKQLKKSKVHHGTNDPLIYERFDIKTMLPGPSQLKLQAWDHDTVGYNDLIGSTVIDLEDRWFSQQWQRLGKGYQSEKLKRLALKPLERRSLWTPLSSSPQGKVGVWLDIVNSTDAKKYPPVDITPPPKEEWELRVIVWKCKEMAAEDVLTDMNDLFVKCWLDGEDEQSTDIHWAAKKGGGSFNWRMKFPVNLGGAGDDFPAKRTYLRFQAWDQDVVKWSDCIAEAAIDLRRAFVQAFKTKRAFQVFDKKRQAKMRRKRIEAKRRAQAAAEAAGNREESGIEMKSNPMQNKGQAARSGKKKPALTPAEKKAALARHKALSKPILGNKKDAKNKEMQAHVGNLRSMVGIEKRPKFSEWLPLSRKNFDTGVYKKVGNILISVELLPKSLADSRPAGFGRSEPNMNPTLPAPVGRVDWRMMWNPCYVIQECCGPKAFRIFLVIFLISSVISFVVYATPLVEAAASLIMDLNDVGTTPAKMTTVNGTNYWEPKTGGYGLGYILIASVFALAALICFVIGRITGRNCLYEILCCNCCKHKEKEGDYSELYDEDDLWDTDDDEDEGSTLLGGEKKN